MFETTEVGIKYKKEVHIQTRESILKTSATFLENVYVYFLFFLLFLRYFHRCIMYRKDNAILLNSLF